MWSYQICCDSSLGVCKLFYNVTQPLITMKMRYWVSLSSVSQKDVVFTVQVCSVVQLLALGFVISYNLKHCRYWKLGSLSQCTRVFATDYMTQVLNHMMLHPFPHFQVFGPPEESWCLWHGKRKTCWLGNFLRILRTSSANTLGGLGEHRGVYSDLMLWSWCRLLYVPMKALQPKYFPVSYFVISSADEQSTRSKGQHPPPQFTQANKMDSLVCVLQKVNRN